MQLTFLIPLFCCCLTISTSAPPPHPDSTWRPSRYIIDNRRNALFSKKPFASLLTQEKAPRDPADFPGPFKQRLPFPVDQGYHKDLTAEASIAGSKFYRKYGENALPRKVMKSLRTSGGGLGGPSEFPYGVGVFEKRENASGVLDEALNEVTSKVAATTEKARSWPEEEVLASGTSTAATLNDNRNTQPRFDFGSPTTTTFPWEPADTKTEEGNQIDNPDEKHVYETRIETVSYHQEVIFNPPKKRDWFRGEVKQEASYEPPEGGYERPEKSYETREENFEEPEKNYEVEGATPGGGVHPAETEDNQNKFGYVVEGTNYRKYRVEERTADGFIVGEYGVVSHDDGSLRGVRYTAEGGTNPQLIYETLIKFLSL